MPQISLTATESKVLADVVVSRRKELEATVHLFGRNRASQTPEDREVVIVALGHGIVLQHVAAKLRKAQAKANRPLRVKIPKRNVTVDGR